MLYLHNPMFLLKTVLWLVIFFFSAVKGIAQQQYYQSAAKAYYQIFTQYDTRSTIIRFYNQYDELMYEETIRGKYIKMTKKNVRLLNYTLEQLSKNGLLTDQLKATALLTDNRPELDALPTQILRDELKAKQAADHATDSRFNFAIFPLIQPGKFKVLFDNPQGEKVKILLKDNSGFTIYEENSFSTDYNRDFNLAGMKPGIYRLEVYKKQLLGTRQLNLQYSQQQARLDILTSDTTTSAVSTR